MLDPIRHLFSANGFMPHGMCYLWQPGILGLHLTSDALITLGSHPSSRPVHRERRSCC